MDKTLHKHMVKGFGHNDVSPAALAYKMLHESKYVNESVLAYAINYINIMATYPAMPMHLSDVHQICKTLRVSLEELGLVGPVGRVAAPSNEYLAV